MKKLLIALLGGALVYTNRDKILKLLIPKPGNLITKEETIEYLINYTDFKIPNPVKELLPQMTLSELTTLQNFYTVTVIMEHPIDQNTKFYADIKNVESKYNITLLNP